MSLKLKSFNYCFQYSLTISTANNLGKGLFRPLIQFVITVVSSPLILLLVFSGVRVTSKGDPIVQGMLDIVTREAWGAANPLDVQLLEQPASKVFLAYSRDDECSGAECRKLLVQEQIKHMNTKGFSDIAYRLYRLNHK